DAGAEADDKQQYFNPRRWRHGRSRRIWPLAQAAIHTVIVLRGAERESFFRASVQAPHDFLHVRSVRNVRIENDLDDDDGENPCEQRPEPESREENHYPSSHQPT